MRELYECRARACLHSKEIDEDTFCEPDILIHQNATASPPPKPAGFHGASFLRMMWFPESARCAPQFVYASIIKGLTTMCIGAVIQA